MQASRHSHVCMCVSVGWVGACARAPCWCASVPVYRCWCQCNVGAVANAGGVAGADVGAGAGAGVGA
eukprot:1992940-Alexandrium_andersonii.AAC.1